MIRARVILFGASLLSAGCNGRNQDFVSDDGTNGLLPRTSPPLPSGAVPLASADPSPASVRPAPPAGPVAVHEPVSFAPIAHSADASVVTINTVSEEIEISPFSHRGRRRETGGLGSGFVIDKNGIVVTNNHVVNGADAIRVKLSDDREFVGKVVGTDPATDIAVVRIETKDLHALPMGDSDAMDVGDWVVAIGNPFGLSHTVSAGIISARGRTREDVPLDPSGYYDFLQTDASINPGNSGGPLLNLKGEVVGINTAIRGDGAQGIGFAIPINMVKQLLPMLLRDGHVTRSALGIRIMDARQLTAEDRAALGLADGAAVTGAVIEYISRGGPADRAGLAPGDVILAFDGQPIERSTQLQWLASTAGVGRSVTVRALRRGKTFEIRLVLSELVEEAPGPGLPR